MIATDQQRLIEESGAQFCLDDLTPNERRILEDDLSLAARIQQARLPGKDVSFPGWEVHYHYSPAGLLSGDYCDFFETDGCLFFMLGDVSGKGVAASMLVSHLHALFRSLAGGPLDHMVEAANLIFCRAALPCQFATLVVGRLARDGSTELVGAGHLPVLHLTRAGIETQISNGVPLGLSPASRFPVQRFSLGLGEGLLMFSDGLTEANNRQGELLGLPRVVAMAEKHRLIRPRALISECLSDLLEFTEGTKPADDLTLLMIRKRRGRIGFGT